MDILTLALPPSLRSKLHATGFHTTAALVTVTPFHLAQQARITVDEAPAVLSSVPRACNDHIGGPLPGGVPGIGKTQLSMQLAVNVQIPVKFCGVGGHAIYVDTEGSFMMERVLQITEAVIDSLRNKSPDFSAEPSNAEDFLSHMLLLRVHDSIEQLSVVNNLPTILDQHKEDFEDMAGRTRLLANMAQKLMAVAENAHKRIQVPLCHLCTWNWCPDCSRQHK